MVYFAYGSNMDPVQMHERCPGSVFLGIARWPGRRLSFTRFSKARGCAVADLVKDPGSTAWGVLWDVPADHVNSLDRIEGYRAGRERNAYERRRVEVETDEGPRLAAVYLAKAEPDPGLPNRAYLAHLIDGAVAHGLPESYVAMLRALPTVD
ncbi:MAG: gamma-glutamylcyclotransferase [Fimbriimonadaceae bacterium]|nr:gamma-glutamylcyclotransferase [Fimbriimonadaceae bacterium]